MLSDAAQRRPRRCERPLPVDPTVVATPVADQVERRGSGRARRRARDVARVGGPVAVAGGILAAGAFLDDRTSATRMWRKGKSRDLGAGILGWTAAVFGWDFIYYWN